MKVSEPKLKLLLGLFVLLLVSGCSDDGSSSSSANTPLKEVNIYFTLDEIFTFNALTGISRKLDDYDIGEHALLPLNTDNEAQGHERIVYTYDQKIYSITANNLTPITLGTVDTNVCIFPNVLPDQSSFEGSTKDEQILIDQTSIYIVPRLIASSECNKETTTVKRMDFSDEDDIIINEVSAANLWSSTLFDFDHKENKDANADNGEKEGPGRYGFLGSRYNFNQSSLALNFYDHNHDTLWETTFPVTNLLPTIDQVTQSEALIQIGGSLHLLNLQSIDNIFDIATIDSDETPTESRLEALFQTPIPDLQTPDTNDLQIASNGDTFALVFDGTVWFYDVSSKKFRSLADKDDTVLAVKIAMMDDGTLLLHRTFADSESLSRINTSSGAEVSIIDNSAAAEIDFRTQDNNIYINAFSPSGWEATWINKFFAIKHYTNSLFAFTKDSRFANADLKLFLIASDEENTVDGYLVQPKLYEFDPANRSNGRKRFKDKNKVSHEFIFGEFSMDVKSIIQSEMFNDVYGKFELKSIRDISGISTDVIDTYFFNPSEQDSFELEKDNKALQLIRFDEDVI